MEKLLEAPLKSLAMAALTLLGSLSLAFGAGSEPGNVHHQLEAVLDPAGHALTVVDEVTLPESLAKDGQAAAFWLHRDLEVESLDAAFKLEKKTVQGEGPALAAGYEVRPASGVWPDPARVRLRYRGVLHHPLESEDEEYARSFSTTPGIIDEKGAVLSGASYWHPVFGDYLATFTLAVTLPEDWDAVSQGARTRHEIAEGRRLVTWDCPDPMDEIHLVAARFTEYSRPAGSATAYAFLREPDPNLAAKYLEATAQYLEMYSRLLGPYPYPKFALVENFWETGFGMPSFTLLGPQVIRFPFILTSSYPHEILHNWWGNSVFVDADSGNWCEGLTAYLADHLFREEQGRGDEYRRDVLQRYVNFVKGERDFPLSQFRSRHSAATEAVGYGKSLMMWHMLRRDLGDETFVAGLRRFYRDRRFQRASFDDLQKAFSAVAKRDLSAFFEQWVDRIGAPELALESVEEMPVEGGHGVRLTIRQDGRGEPYRLSVPLAFAIEGAATATLRTVELSGRSSSFELDLPGRPLALQVDPQFDLFRKLDRREIPSSLGQIFGADQSVIVIPSNDAVASADWRRLAEGWASGDRVAIVEENALNQLPSDRAVWLLGASNRWAKPLEEELGRMGAGLTEGTVSFGASNAPRKGYSFVFTAPHPANPDLAVGWIGTDRPEALPGLARKLPHYGKYSYLGFDGSEPTNQIKGQWPALGSPLSRVMAESGSGAEFPPLPPREPLAKVEPVFSPDRLMTHIQVLTGPEMEGRGLGTPGIERAANYIAAQFQEAGLKPAGDDGSYFQTWTEETPDGRSLTLKNIVAVIPGKRGDWNSQSVVVGAHYDHLGYGWPDFRSGQLGKLHPGADDNASGVAVLLEVARLLNSQLKPDRSLVFVAFTAEEWNLRGSRHYVEQMERWPASDALAMINLDSVGRLQGRPVTLLGTGSADEWPHIARGIGFTTGVESTSVADDFGGSDQKNFLSAGVPAVQVFGGAHQDYHWPSDTADKIDREGLVKIAVWTREAAVYLSERDRPMTSRLSPAQTTVAAPTTSPGETSGRRVSLGTLPDFTYPGPGVMVSQIIPGTPAEAAGMAAGDLILSINQSPTDDLRAFAEILRSLQPGQEIRIVVRRGEEELTLTATVAAR